MSIVVDGALALYERHACDDGIAGIVAVVAEIVRVYVGDDEDAVGAAACIVAAYCGASQPWGITARDVVRACEESGIAVPRGSVADAVACASTEGADAAIGGVLDGYTEACTAERVAACTRDVSEFISRVMEG